VERLFQGKFRVEAASAFLHFSTDGMVQRMLHRLKYKGDDAIGKELGRRMARDVMGSRRFADVDVAIAVPLHPKKLHQRGYNQAQLLVEGMREEWPLQNVDDRLLRIVSTSSQTRRGRLDRWQNVRTAFAVANESALKDKHVLLVDDVITTGATIEACARALENVPGVRISVLACACA
jgi:ComF family protein